MIVAAVLCALLVQEQKTPDLFEELLGSDAVVRLSVVQDKGATLSGRIVAVFKGDSLKPEEGIEVGVDRDRERARLQATVGKGCWFNLSPEKDQSAVFLLGRVEKAWRVRFVLFGGPRSEAATYQEPPERAQTQDEAVRTCLEIARATPADGALLLAKAVCEKTFASRTHPEILRLYEPGLPSAAPHLAPESEAVKKIVSVYHPKVVEVARKFVGLHPGLVAWFTRLGSEEQRKAIVAALVQRHDDLDVEIRNLEKRKADADKVWEDLGLPYERELSIDDLFGPSYRADQSSVRSELGRILLPGEPPRSFREEQLRTLKIVSRARDYLKK